MLKLRPLTFDLSKPVRQPALFWLALILISWSLQVSSIHLQHSQMVSACVCDLRGKCIASPDSETIYRQRPYASCVTGPLYILYFEMLHIWKLYLCCFVCVCVVMKVFILCAITHQPQTPLHIHPLQHLSMQAQTNYLTKTTRVKGENWNTIISYI